MSTYPGIPANKRLGPHSGPYLEVDCRSLQPRCEDEIAHTGFYVLWGRCFCFCPRIFIDESLCSKLGFTSRAHDYGAVPVRRRGNYPVSGSEFFTVTRRTDKNRFLLCRERGIGILRACGGGIMMVWWLHSGRYQPPIYRLIGNLFDS